MRHLILAAALVSCDPVDSAASLTEVGGIDVRSDCYGPVDYDTTWFPPDYAEHNCRPYARIVIPSGYCAVTRGVVAGLSRELHDTTSCEVRLSIGCQMWAEPPDSGQFTELYVDSRSNVRFRKLIEGCACQ